MHMFFSAFKSSSKIFISLSLLLLSGCALNMKVPITDPAASNTLHQVSAAKPVALFFKDEQAAEDKTKLLGGTIPMQLVYGNKPFDAVPWIAEHTVKEMVARGLPVALATQPAAGPNVLIKRLHIENHRASGFSPFVTFTSLRAEIETPQGNRRITAYIKRGKVPVWSFDEIIEPTYNAPLALLTKELAAKLNQQLFNTAISDEQVRSLVQKINQNVGKEEGSAYLDVYQLGFGNNPLAIPELVKYTSSSNEYVRLSAISSLGILKASDQVEFLKKLFSTKSGLWQDRAMALKALGDIDTPETRAYLQEQLTQLQSRTDKEAKWTKEIIALYL
ncbi:MAG: HEAT repeat domain-containing protein [Methylophilus sp.]|uniref:HEAT repeat domain-containing protein n=1 Tax=Methylophilus sp. TaxID=29541 RepID=UPI003FA0DF55